MQDVCCDTTMGRRYREHYYAVAALLGGPGKLSALQVQLVGSAAALMIQREELDQDKLQGRKVDADKYTRILNGLVKCYDRLGIDTKPKRDEVEGAGPTLEEYAADLGQQHTVRPTLKAGAGNV